MGRGIDSRNRVWNWVAKLHRLAGRYDNPMPTWFLAPIAGLKLPTLISKVSLGSMRTAVLIDWDPARPQPPSPPAFGLIYVGTIGQPRYTTSLCDPLTQEIARVSLTISWRFDSAQAKEHNKHEPAVKTICYFYLNVVLGKSACFFKRDDKNRRFFIFISQDFLL